MNPIQALAVLESLLNRDDIRLNNKEHKIKSQALSVLSRSVKQLQLYVSQDNGATLENAPKVQVTSSPDLPQPDGGKLSQKRIEEIKQANLKAAETWRQQVNPDPAQAVNPQIYPDPPQESG